MMRSSVQCCRCRCDFRRPEKLQQTPPIMVLMESCIRDQLENSMCYAQNISSSGRGLLVRAFGPHFEHWVVPSALYIMGSNKLQNRGRIAKLKIKMGTNIPTDRLMDGQTLVLMERARPTAMPSKKSAQFHLIGLS